MDNTDYTTFNEKVSAQKRARTYEQKNHILKLDMAKHIAMIQRSEQGKQIRQKLIQLETDVSTLSPELQLLIKLEVNQKKQAAQIESTNKRIDNLSKILQLNSKNWREDSIKIMKRIGYATGDYRRAWADVYSEVERRGGFNLKTRLAHAQENARKAGAPESVIGKMKYLHVIEMDKRLIEIYLAIVKEYAVRNGVSADDID